MSSLEDSHSKKTGVVGVRDFGEHCNKALQSGDSCFYPDPSSGTFLWHTERWRRFRRGLGDTKGEWYTQMVRFWVIPVGSCHCGLSSQCESRSDPCWVFCLVHGHRRRQPRGKTWRGEGVLSQRCLQIGRRTPTGFDHLPQVCTRR